MEKSLKNQLSTAWIRLSSMHIRSVLPRAGRGAVALIAALLSAPQLSAQGEQALPKYPTPAHAAFGQWFQEQAPTAGRVLSPQVQAAGLALAQARNAEMRALLEKDPAGFIRQAMPANERAQLPAELQAQIEERIKGRGS